MNQIVEIKQRPQPIVIEDSIPILDTGRFEHMQRIATVMAKCSFIPESLIDKTDAQRTIANCFMIVNQATRWQMDPFALAQHAYVLKGKIGYEGKVIAAAINADPRVEGRLNYEFEGEVATENRKVIASAKFADTQVTRIVEGTTKKWRTGNEQWKGDCDQQLTYRAAREWARRWMPERLLGVYSDDEVREIAERKTPMRDVTPRKMLDLPDIPEVPAVPDIPDVAEPADEPLVDQPAFVEMLRSSMSSAESRSDLREIITGNAGLTRRCSTENRAKIAGLYREAMG